MKKKFNQRKDIFIIILITSILISVWVGYNLNSVSHQRLIDKLPEVIFSEQITQDLKQFYQETGKNEYAICLEGYEEDETLYITGYKHYTLGNETAVMNNYLCDGFIGHLHKHPDGVYLTSLSDASFYYDRFNAGLKIMMIQYGENKISIKSRTNWFEGNNVKI